VTNRLEVKVIDPLPEPGQTKIPWGIVLPVLLVVCAGAIVLWYLVKKREEKRRREELANVVPPEDQFLQELKSSFDINSAEVDIKESTSGLSRLYRRYLAEKYSIKALEATSTEVLAALQHQNLEERMLRETEEILTKCDLTKFAGSSGDLSELQRIYTLTEDILRRNVSRPQNNQEETSENEHD
jgi:hypothetical protein